jgi:hypothetical protein
MRPIKRVLILVSEVGVLLVGLAASALLVVTLAYLSDSGGLALSAAFIGFLLTIGGWLIFRREMRPWKLEYDAAGWALDRAERKEHPGRAKCKRVLRRILLYVPSAIAAMVLFCFPFMSHLLHPSSRYLRNYRIPIPWTYIVWPLPPYGDVTVIARSDVSRWPFSMMPLWDSSLRFSIMTFGSAGPDVFGFEAKLAEDERTGATRGVEREFRLDTVALSCWQFVPARGRGVSFAFAYLSWPYYEVDCWTAADVRPEGFWASFQGRESDLPLFYEVVAGVTPVK